MFTMTAVSDIGGSCVVAISGCVSAGSLPEIGRLIQDGRGVRKQIVIDLGEVTLLDRAAAQFFAELLQHGVELVNCPIYIKPWISREANHETERNHDTER